MSRILLLLCGSAFAMANAAEVLRDPTRPLTMMHDTVTMIMQGQHHSVALINGQQVTVGDHIASGRVTAITAHSVTIQTKDKKIIHLHLIEPLQGTY